MELLPRTDLAVRAIRHLAQHPGHTSSDIAAAVGTTPGFLTQVLRPLVSAGVLTSARGPNGGYGLQRGSASILEIIEILEGPTDDGRCVLRDSTCHADQPCALHDAWVDARNALTERLAAVPVVPFLAQEESA